MKVKDSTVDLFGLKLEMRIVMKICDEVYTKHGQDYTVTSACDGLHMAGSFHYFGYAIDSKVFYFTDEVQVKVAEEITEKLKNISQKYKVILHKGHHIHIHYHKELSGIASGHPAI